MSLHPDLQANGFTLGYGVEQRITDHAFLNDAFSGKKPQIEINEALIHDKTGRVIASKGLSDFDTLNPNNAYASSHQGAVKQWLELHSDNLARLLNQAEKAAGALALTRRGKRQKAQALNFIDTYAPLLENPQAYVVVHTLPKAFRKTALPMGMSFEIVKVFSGNFDELPTLETDTVVIDRVQKDNKTLQYQYRGENGSVCVAADFNPKKDSLASGASNVRIVLSRAEAYRFLMVSTEKLNNKLRDAMVKEGLL